MLAIIIPYYKLTYFEDTLNSLANQTDQRFKVYIGDDASPESPAHLLEKYKGKFDFEYHRFETNFGGISLTKQWERCVELTENEEWIMILGDDDVLMEYTVEQFYCHYAEFYNKSNVVRLATKVIDSTNNTISQLFEHPIWEKATDAFFRRHVGKTRSSLSEFFFFKNKIIQKGFKEYPLGWYSDNWAVIDFSNTKMIYSINNISVFIRISEESITGNMGNNQLKKEATHHFYKDLITEKLHLFNTEQKLDLLLYFEVLIKKTRKLTMNEWFILFCQYFKVFNILSLVKVFRRFLISLINEK